MAQDSANNVINNYKGVMLCSRPNQKKSLDIDKPFCPRVVPGELLGLNPIKKQHEGQQQPKKKKIAALQNHKKWLNQFKGNIQKTKEEIQEKAKKEEQKFQRIKEQGEADRQRAKKMKQQYNQTATAVLNVLDQKSPPSLPANAQLNSQNLRILDTINEKKKKQQFKKKSQKPVWALTKDQVQEKQEQQVDELLDFFQNNNVNDYSEDAQIKNLLANLKQKIENMKQEDNWKQKETQKIKKNRQSKKQGEDDDKYSHFSVGNSQGRSVASQKTQKKIEQLRNKKQEQQEWDKFTTSQKSSLANIDDKIAKNLADEVLRNYPNMKGIHSNVSIRKLLQAEATRVLNEPIMRPVISTIVKQKQQLNANNLPYLHRNPAI